MNESLHCKIRTQDGREVTIRPITPDDAAIERDFIENLSPVSRHYRFMGGVGRPTGRMIHYFTHVDYSRNCALIGTVDAGGMERKSPWADTTPWKTGRPANSPSSSTTPGNAGE